VRRLALWSRCALAAAMLAVLSCAPARRPPEVQELVFWQSWPLEVVSPIVADFERAHPGIKLHVERLTNRCGEERVLAAVAAGTVPDLCQIGSAWMPGLLAGSRLADWSAGVADLRPGLRGWELCSVGEVIYGVPWVLETRALFYNKTLFARARLDSTRPPETWDELRRAAAAIQRLGHGVHGYGVQVAERQVLSKKVLPFLFANGGSILSDDLRRAVFDSVANVQALEFFLNLRRVGTMGQQEALDREFREGRLGLDLSGAWLFEQIPREASGLRYGVALVPRPAAGRGTDASWAGGEVLVSFNDSKHKQLALELARFLVRPENLQRLAAAVKSVQPATVGTDTSACFRERPQEMTMARQLGSVRFTPNHPAWRQMEAAIEDEVEQALYDRKSAAQAVKDAQAKLAELVGKQ
jgi:multiple sugar transport system substrate-binding protein